MGLEKNKEYEISNRLIGLEFLELAGIKGTQNQILPRDHRDPQVIYWVTTEGGTVTFYHCTDRNIVSTCRMMGARGYTKVELNEAYKKVYKALKTGKRLRIGLWTSSVVLLLLAAAGLFLPAAAAGGVVSSLLSAATVGAFIAGIAGGIFGDTSVQDSALDIKQLVSLRAGVTKRENFRVLVQNLNEFLLTAEPSLDLKPEPLP